MPDLLASALIYYYAFKYLLYYYAFPLKMTTDIWLEKYRSKRLDDIYRNEHIVSCLKQFAEMRKLSLI